MENTVVIQRPTLSQVTTVPQASLGSSFYSLISLPPSKGTLESIMELSLLPVLYMD